MRRNTALSDLAARTDAPPISWLMDMALGRPHLISLAAGFTDDVSLPVEETRALLEEILSSPKAARKSLQYGSTAGDPRLRELTAERLARQDHAQAGAGTHNKDSLIITHGSQQLLYLTVETLCNPGDIVLVEDPSYFVFLGILQSHGVRCRGVRMEPDGLNLAQLEAVLEELKQAGELPRLKMLYLVTYFQNPSGITTSAAKKEAALRLLRKYERAAGHPLYLLEDAAYRELRFGGEDQPSTLVFDGAAERVIYAGTYSKPFATGIRVGFGRMPEDVLKVVLRFKGNHDFGTSNLLQQIVRAALASDLYDKHLAALRARYQKKAKVMARAIESHFPREVAWEEPQGGLYVWAKAPRSARTDPQSKVFQQALKNDVLYVPGSLCYGQDETRRVPRHEMRLSFGGASEKAIREGILRLGEALREAMN